MLRLRQSLPLAMAVHVALVAHLANGWVSATVPAPAPPPRTELDLDVTTRETTPRANAPRQNAGPGAGALAQLTASVRDVPTTNATRSAMRGEAPDAAVLGAAPTWAFSPIAAPTSAVTGRVDFPARDVAPRAPAPRDTPIARSLREGLAERDVSLGIGLERGSALVAALHDVAESGAAPDVGRANVDVTCDAGGAVVEARTDEVAWQGVASALVVRMKGKSVRVAQGAKGLRARLLVVAERALPGGARGTTSPGAIPDDVAGSANHACVGEGLTRRCVSGLPVGVTESRHDAVNVGSRASRVVHVQLLGESEL